MATLACLLAAAAAAALLSSPGAEGRLRFQYDRYIFYNFFLKKRKQEQTLFGDLRRKRDKEDPTQENIIETRFLRWSIGAFVVHCSLLQYTRFWRNDYVKLVASPLEQLPQL